MKPSQNTIILRMLKYGPVTPLEALEMADCFRLSARIYDLRHAGHNIVMDLIERNGKHFASYRLQRKRHCKPKGEMK
jgi:hypothetical protein